MVVSYIPAHWSEAGLAASRAEETPEYVPHSWGIFSKGASLSLRLALSPANDVGKMRLVSVKETEQLLLPYIS